jgi:pimeloyl-ACP methyl ester carboxylesterase
VSDRLSFYLDRDGEPILALFDPPAAGVPSRIGVLIVPPWGWDEVASYRSRMRWAEQLAAASHPVLRIDLPGNGDSGGDSAAPNLVEDWIEAITLAGEWLRGEAGAAGLALLGLGLGGLLAEEAIGRGLAAEELICWGSPPSGRHFSREMRAFAALQAGRPAESEGEPKALPDGWLEAGGFVLSAATLAALKRFEPVGVPLSRQALLIGRDGIADTPGGGRLAAAGVEVTEDEGSGWAAFVGHPETTELPEGIEQVVRGWLGRAAGESEGMPPAAPPVPVAAASRAGFRDGHSEEAVRVAEDFGDAFGILTRPASSDAEVDYCVVFLNAGAIRHIGPNRLWAEAARDLARAGVPSLRVDLESIGEADGDELRRAEVADFYDTGFVAEVVGVLDWLEHTGVASRFRLVGLCAGGYWAFRTGLADDRIESMVLLNAGALVWHPRILEQRDDRRFGRVFRPHWWRMLMRGEIQASSALRLVRLVPAAVTRLVRRPFAERAASGGTAIAADLSSLPADRRLVLAFSGSEPLREELEAVGVADHLDRWPGVEIVELPGADHTLRPATANRAALDLIGRETIPGAIF